MAIEDALRVAGQLGWRDVSAEAERARILALLDDPALEDAILDTVAENTRDGWDAPQFKLAERSIRATLNAVAAWIKDTAST